MQLTLHCRLRTWHVSEGANGHQSILSDCGLHLFDTMEYWLLHMGGLGAGGLTLNLDSGLKSTFTGYGLWTNTSTGIWTSAKLVNN